MKKFSKIGLCAITLILVASLAMPAIAAATATVVHYQYNGALVPDEYPSGAWERFDLETEHVDWYSDRGMFHIDAEVNLNPYLSYGIGFLRAEPSLAIANETTMTTRMRVERSGGWVFDFVWGILDGEKAIPVVGQLDPQFGEPWNTWPEPYNIGILVEPLGWIAMGTVPLNELATYRVEVVRGEYVELYCNDRKVDLFTDAGSSIEVLKYKNLLDVDVMAELIALLGGGGMEVPLTSIAIGCYSSHVVYDDVALHGWSVPAPVELPSPGR